MRGKIIALLVAALAVFCFATAHASEELLFVYNEFYVTMAVGDTVSFEDLYFHSSNTGHYTDIGKPGAWVSGDAYAISVTHDTQITAGSPFSSTASSDYIYANLDCTITALQPGEARVSFYYGSYDLYTIAGEHIMVVPRINVTVTNSGACSVTPLSTLNSEKHGYSLPPDNRTSYPMPVRPNWTFKGWYTQPSGGMQIADEHCNYIRHDNYSVTESTVLYAQWEPDFQLVGRVPVNNDIVDIPSGSQIETELAVIPYDAENGVGHDGFTYQTWIWNYEALRYAIAGDPQWSFELTQDPGLEYGIQYNGASYVMLRTDGKRPQSKATAKFNVSCEWGGVTKQFTLTLRFVEAALPTGCNTPMQFNLQVGQTSAFDIRFDKNYSFRDNIWFSGYINEYDNDRFISMFKWYNEGNTLYLTPLPGSAGYWKGNISIVDQNVGIWRDTIFCIADENGTPPDLSPQIPSELYNVDMVCRVGDDHGHGYKIEPGEVLWLFAENYRVLDMLYGDDYSWSFETLDGAELEMDAERTEWNNFNMKVLNVEDMQPDTRATVAATLSWGDVSATCKIHYHFIEVDLPATIDWEDDITMTVGKAYTAFANVSPRDWIDTYFLYYNLWDDGGAFDCRLVNRVSSMDDPVHCYLTMMGEPGYYSGNAHIHARNLFVYGPGVVYRVADENGDLPDAQVMLREYEQSYDIPINLPIGPDGVHVTYFWPEIGNVVIENFGTLARVLDGKPAWSIERLDDADYDISISPWGNREGANLIVDRLPEAPGEADFRVRIDWDGVLAWTDVHLNFYVVGEPPEDIDIERSVTMKVGESHTFHASYTTEWPHEQGREWLNMGLRGIENEGDYFVFEPDWTDCTVTAKQPGYYRMWADLIYDSIIVTAPGDIVVRVTDKYGNLPEIAPFFELEEGYVFETNYLLGRMANDEREGWVSDPHAFGWVLDEVEPLIDAYGGDPEVQWRYEYVSGMNVDLELELEADRVYGDLCWVTVSEMPGQTGTMTFDLICDWAGHEGGMRCVLNFIDPPQNVPVANTFPDTLGMLVGDTYGISGHFADGEYDVSEFFSWIAVDGDYIRVEQPNDDGFYMEVTALKPGTVTGVGFVRARGNYRAFVQKRITFNILDPDEVAFAYLPEDLKRIEEEAFAGIDAQVVVVPDGCESIGSRAFANCPNLFKVEVPWGIDIAEDAFDGCDSVYVAAR